MLLSKAIEGFVLHARGGRYSPNYIPAIEGQARQIIKFFGDREVESLTVTDWLNYFNYLRHDYKPKRLNGDQSPLSEATIDNHWKMIRSFYGWATTILSIERPDLKLPRPKYESPETIPFTQDECKRILEACEYTQVIKQSGRTYRIKRPNADRDKTIVMILLDTGIRSGEFKRLRIGDVNLENGEVYIRPYRDGRKSKPRTVFLGIRTRQIVWKYIAKMQANEDQSQPLIDISSASIRILLRRIGHNAKVPHVHPQRFRNTMAITYLRNGGDVFTLQRLLGHSTLEMTQRYLAIAKSDVANAHKNASPVDRWKL